jgi:hypothetical protein
MNRSDMRTNALYKLQEISTNTAFDANRLNEWLQEGWRTIYSRNNILWSFLRKHTLLTNVYTTVSAESSDDELNATAVSGMVDNQVLYITDGTVYEKNYIDMAVVASPITLEYDLVNTYDSGDLIISNMMALPAGIRQIYSVVAENIETASQELIKLKRVDERDIIEKEPILTSTGTPTSYYVLNDYLYVYPLPDDSWRYHINYVSYGTALSDAATPELPIDYHDMIVDYAIAQALFSDITNPQHAQLAGYYENKFEKRLRELMFNNTFTPDGNYTLGESTFTTITKEEDW